MLRVNQLTGFGSKRTSGVLWTPANLGANLRAWYKGDEISGSNGDAIATWTNAEGTSGRDMVQSGSGKPTLAAADLNSMNTVRFTSSSSQFFQASSGSFYSGASAAAIYFVMKAANDPATSGSASGWMRFGSEVSVNAAEAYVLSSDGHIYSGFASTARKDCGNPSVSMATYRIFAIQSSTNNWGCAIDGGTGGSSGGTSTFFQTNTNTVGFETTASSTLIGKSYDGISGIIYLDGWIAEAVLTNTGANSSDRYQMEGYLAYKWGLQGNLDSTHTYKSSPPTI